jgi:hypothetical protein
MSHCTTLHRGPETTESSLRRVCVTKKKLFRYVCFTVRGSGLRCDVVQCEQSVERS